MTFDALLEQWRAAGIETQGWSRSTTIASISAEDQIGWWMALAVCERAIDGELPDDLIEVLVTLDDLHHFTATRASAVHEGTQR